MKPTRKFLIAANWKMNPIPQGALDDDSPYRERGDIDVIVFPTYLGLQKCTDARLITGAQYGGRIDEPLGAFTGDISMKMVADIGADYVLCGHSERRLHHKETDEDVAAQAIAALEAGLHPIVCIGETEKERKKGKQKKVIAKQLKSLPLESKIILAYEPVWAISKGDPNKPAATAQDAQEMHAYIRSLLPADRRETTRILYGGSMKPENANELLSQPDIDGGLVGGASLKPEAFKQIVEAATLVAAEA